MLNRLVEYAERRGLAAEPGFARKDIRWALVFGDAGEFLEVIELGDVEAKRNTGRTFAQAPDMPRPILQGGGKCHPLAESIEVVTLFLDKKSSPEKIGAKHDYYCLLLEQCSSAMPELLPVVACLRDQERLATIRERLEAQKVKATDSCTIAFGSRFPLESGPCLDWWRGFIKSLRGDGKTDRETQAANGKWLDFVSGEPCQPIASHPKIKGLSSVGGLAMGDSLVSFDKEAFGSYTLDSGGNAAMSDQSAALYSEVLNGLIRDHGKRLCGALVVHWFKEQIKPEDDPLAWLEQGTDEEEQAEAFAQGQVAKFLDRPRSGAGSVHLRNNLYYALTLSGAAGRVMVRDWMEGQFAELAGNIDAWFDDLSVIRQDGLSQARAPKFLAVVGATVRVLDDAPAPMIAGLWRAAVKNEPIPAQVMARALTRVRVSISQDDPINSSAIGLLKAYHLRKNKQKGETAMSEPLRPALNETHPSPAYQCGRLMAVLAGLQHAALGDVGAGVVQRYYAAASATPALVLGRLLRTAQFHIGKLEGGLAHWYDGKLASIMLALKDTIPATLTLEEQSLFALGYYQQLADLRTKKSETKEA